MVPWHRDASTTQVGGHPIFNVDVYLDAADRATALWVIPGSHRPSDQEARAAARQRSDASVHPDGFDFAGATCVPMQAGDVQVLSACIDARRTQSVAAEVPYRYAPPVPYDRAQPPTFRVPHSAYWRMETG